jgi:hypothetical protein
MKSRGGRSCRRRVASLIGIDILECKQLLSTAGAVGDVAAVDRSEPVAVSAAPVAADAVPRGSNDAPSAPTRAPSGPIPGPPAASVASTASSDGNTGPAAAEQADTATQAVSAQPGASAIAPDVPGNGLSGPSNPTSGNGGPTGSAVDSPVADQPGDLGWTFDAGVAQSDGIDEATLVAPLMSVAVSVPVRSGPLVNGGAMTRPSDHGLSGLEPGPDGAPPTVAGASAVLRIAVRAPGRMTAGLDVTVDSAQSRGESEIIEAGAGDEPRPSFQYADLLTEFLPFDRATLEHAIDTFLEPLADLGSEWASGSPSTSLIATATLVVTTSLAAEVVRRRVLGGQPTVVEGDEDLGRFPGYVSAWELGES